MRITLERLGAIIEEEVRSILEADEPKSKKGKKPDTKAADEEPTAPKEPAEGGGADPITSAPSPSDKDGNSVDVPMDDIDDSDPTDGEGEDDAEALDSDGNAGEDPSGAVNNEVSGKTVQSISVEPKSKVLPGAKEIVVTFNESTDALRILLTSTGTVKFFWRGQLHDIP